MGSLRQLSKGDEAGPRLEQGALLNNFDDEFWRPGHTVANENVCVRPVCFENVPLPYLEWRNLHPLLHTALLDLLNGFRAHLGDYFKVLSAVTRAKFREHDRCDRTW